MTMAKKPTPSQTVGPFFARELLWKDGGTVLFPGHGERITLTGCVFDGAGAPIFDALVETWQADSAGRFPSGDDGARPYGYGRVSTDTDGRYAIETVMPGSFKGPGGETYAPQISVSIFARGLLKALQTRVFLAPLEVIKDDPLARAVGDPERLRTLIAVRDPRDPKIYRWDVRLRGAGEAVFIEY
jgi:protocatechuate 3,4-dioxygenase, alpha subunit